LRGALNKIPTYKNTTQNFKLGRAGKPLDANADRYNKIEAEINRRKNLEPPPKR